jgi:hypothetical protein
MALLAVAETHNFDFKKCQYKFKMILACEHVFMTVTCGRPCCSCCIKQCKVFQKELYNGAPNVTVWRTKYPSFDTYYSGTIVAEKFLV